MPPGSTTTAAPLLITTTGSLSRMSVKRAWLLLSLAALLLPAARPSSSSSSPSSSAPIIVNSSSSSTSHNHHHHKHHQQQQHEQKAQQHSRETANNVEYKLVPRLYGDRVPARLLDPGDRRVQRKLVLYHNFFRSRVEPPAADMLAMTWHTGAARAAQRWADQCLALTHDNATGLHTDDFGRCGQNIFISTARVPWFFAIKTWFAEERLFKFGSEAQNELSKVGHYTQMVWSRSHEVGCGWAACNASHNGPMGYPYYTYVCNYCPAGNREGTWHLPYTAGPSCSSCPGHCRLGRLCTNSCSWADLWSNCRELQATWPDWLCSGRHKKKTTGIESEAEQQAAERLKFCRATCECGASRLH